MIKHLVCCLLLACAFASAVQAQAPAPAPAAPQQVAGFIVASRIRGTVTAVNKTTGETITLIENQRISQDYKVSTAKGASVILIFENGATVSVDEDSDLDIQKFTMDPFSGPETHIADLQKEPTHSKTNLAMTKGKMVGKIVHLDVDGGSEFTIATPVGAAGIRGTTFELTFRPNADGTGAILTLTTADGRVVFQGAASLAGVSIPAGKQISTTVTVNTTNQPGQPTTYAATGTISSTDVSATQLAAIATVAQTIVDTVTNSNITITPVTTDASSSGTTSSSSSSTSTSTSGTTSSTSSSTSSGSSGSGSSGSSGTLNVPQTKSLTPGD